MSIIGLEHRPDELNLSHLRDDTGVAASGNIPSGASPGTHHVATRSYVLRHRILSVPDARVSMTSFTV